MTLSSDISTTSTALSDIKSAIIAKGVTPSGNITTYATAIGNITATPVIASLSVTPTTSAQTITAPSGTDGYSPISVSAVTSSIDNNIVAGNIKSGVTILGVSGTVTALNGDTLSVTPTTSAQTLTPTSPKNGYTQVSVSAVTSSIDANITADNIKKDVTILGVTGTYEGSGGGGSSGKYQLLERIKDDNNNEIGTVSGFFKDANDTEYAVVCLDAQYRVTNSAWASTRATVTNLTEYSMNGAAVDLIANTYTDTATSNCDKILAWCTAGGYTSAAVSHCRSKSFVIGGTTYYGQLPNLCELFNICANRTAISNADTSKSSYSSYNIATWPQSWSSSQSSSNNAWYVHTSGVVNNYGKTSGFFVCPVLEIPNAV